MIRKALASVVVAAALAAPATAAAGSSAGSLSGFACKQAHNPLVRMVKVTATMRPLAGTERMAMRFGLLERLPGARFHQVYGGDLGQWRHPTPATLGQQPGDTWIVNKPVVNLGAPARYRFRVAFRWILWSGQVVIAKRLSPICGEAP